MRILTLTILLATTGCGASEQPERPAQTSQPRPPAISVIARPDSELTRYLAWNREWMLLTNRHRAESESEFRRVQNRYSLRGADSIAQDPGLLQLYESQRAEMQLHMARAPRGATVDALDATLPGLGQMRIGPMEMTWVPGRDEAVLSAAGAQYGEEFVRWVLAHESTIVATLRSDR